MSKHEIEIKGLPEGWEPKEILLIECESNDNDQRIYGAQVIVKKKQPRRIVLEETDYYHEPEDNAATHTQIFQIDNAAIGKIISNKIWREVNETAPSLQDTDDKESLCLSREQCRELLQFSSSAIEMIKDFLRGKS